MVPIEVDMIEIETGDWPVHSWWEVIEWCSSTFGPCQADSWWFENPHDATHFLLRWA